jgi:hypothetical protein
MGAALSTGHVRGRTDENGKGDSIAAAIGLKCLSQNARRQENPIAMQIQNKNIHINKHTINAIAA